MPIIKLSKDAAIKAKKLISMQLMNLNDKPSTKKYDEMMSEIQSLMSQLRNNFNDINEYCDKVIRWIDEYNSH